LEYLAACPSILAWSDGQNMFYNLFILLVRELGSPVYCVSMLTA